MLDDEIAKFFGDLGVDSSSDIVALLISKYMGAQEMGTYSKEEFIKGCEALGCDSIASWKQMLTSRLYPELK